MRDYQKKVYAIQEPLVYYRKRPHSVSSSKFGLIKYNIRIYREVLGFSKPSVSRAVGLLRNGGYIDTDSDGHLLLTELGKEIAEKIYERHRVLTEIFKSLGVDGDTASEDACKIEHDLSDTTFNAVKEYAERNNII